MTDEIKNQERALIGSAVGVAYGLFWLMALFVLFRFGVAALWGSGSDLGVFAAPVLAGAGLIGLAVLAVVMARHVRAIASKQEN